MELLLRQNYTLNKDKMDIRENIKIVEGGLNIKDNAQLIR